MADPNQYILRHRELVEVLIKHVGLHEGEWTLLANIAISTGLVSPAPEIEGGPGVTIAIMNMGLQRQAPGEPVKPGAVVVDAAKTNPKAAGKTKKKALAQG